MQTLLQDVRYGLRMLRKTPGFTLVAVVTLALGIGANTSIFSIVNALLMRPLPVDRPGELAVIGNPARVHSWSSGSPQSDVISYPLYRELLRSNQAFTDIYASGNARAKVSIETNGQTSPPENARARIVTGNYFSVLGVNAFLGRTFTAADDHAPGSDPYVVISYRYWARRFNRDPAIIGKTLRLNGYPLTIIGVTPLAFFGDVVGDMGDLWVPMMMQAQVMPGRDWLNSVENSWLLLMGRRKPGVTLAQAQSEMKLDLQQVATSTFVSRFDKDNQAILKKLTIDVSDGAHGFSSMRQQLTRPLLLLMGIVGLVLLIACVNVANLLLARSTARQTEIAVRLAIGASPARVARQLVTESILLSLLGGVAGIVLANWATQFLLAVVTGSARSVPLDLGVDVRVLLFTGTASVLTGILFGMAPALRALHVELAPTLKSGARTGTGAGANRHSLGRYLVSAQVALSILVLFTAAILIRSLKKLETADTGYEREHVLLIRVDGAAAGYHGPAFVTAMLQLRDRFQHLPGVRAASFSENGLFSGSESSDGIIVEGFTPAKQPDKVANNDTVGPAYFKTVGIPLLLGRDIGEQDTATSPHVAVINEAMAKFYFAGRNPIGRKLYVDDEKVRTVPIEIVGVARDVRDHDVRGQVPRRFYMPLPQVTHEVLAVNFELRAAAAPSSLVDSTRNAVHQFDANIPIESVSTLDDLVDDSVSEEIATAKLCSLFAGLALLLACVGLYGLLSYAVAGRTREIGLRMALGANRSSLLWLVMREALVMVAAGVAIGLPVAVASGRALRSMLFEVSAADPLSMAGSVLLLGAVALAAAYVPARRATRIDPMVALRYE